MLKTSTDNRTRPCPHCGYDLAGLPKAQPCPECGRRAPSDADKPRKYDIYGRAPLSYLKLVQAAAWMMAMGAIVAGGSSIVASGVDSPVPRLLAVFASAVYLAGIWILTAPRRSPSLPRAVTAREFMVLRWVNRATQSLWAVTHLLILLWQAGKLSDPVATPLLTSTLIIAGLGIIPCSFQLAAFAEWTRDEDTARRMNIAAWCIGLPVVWFSVIDFIPVIGTLLAIAFWFLSIAFFFLFFGGFLLYLLACFGLARTASWAILNWQQAEARDQRLREKADAARRKSKASSNAGRARTQTADNPGGASLAQRDAEFDAAFSKISITSDTPAGAPIPKNMHRIERRSDDDPIPLEPE